MPDKHIFISYSRAEPTARIANLLYKRIRVNLGGHGFAEPFFDWESVAAGERWRERIESALDRATHFIALLSDDYWLSDNCQCELKGAVERWEAANTRPRLLFVLTERMDPSALIMQRGERSAKIDSNVARIERLSEINFLGPYDAAGRLIRLDCNNDLHLSDQLYELVQDLRAIN